MLTTSVDGLWVLQVLTGIEVLAPELGLRPHLPRAESKQQAVEHPVAAELREHKVIDDDGNVDEPVREWLTVIARRDLGLVVHVTTPDALRPRRVLLARFAQWWVVLERSGELVRVSSGGTATGEDAAGLIITDQLNRLCGAATPAALRPVTLDADAMAAAAGDPDGARRYLIAQGLDADQVQLLSLAADPDRSAQASIVAAQCGIENGSAVRTQIAPGVVTIIDTPVGRLLAEHLDRHGRRWTVLSPGAPGNVAKAITAMVRNLPAEGDWHSYRKIV